MRNITFLNKILKKNKILNKSKKKCYFCSFKGKYFMNLFKNIIILFAVLTIGLVGCKKNIITPDNYFETTINNASETFVPEKANITKGITIIAAINKKNNSKKAIVITINGDKIGNYKQTFDYKTGVSVSQCGLSYKTISKLDESSPTFFSSYEGAVEIEELDRDNKNITGTYSFKLSSIPNNNKPYFISGKFVKLSYLNSSN